jgi:multicomponent Na+:H+ antiporter subunit G
MNVRELLSAALLLCGAFFFVAGTVGILRFPDVYTRLHAVTKADNLGLGFVTVALVLQAGTVFGAIEIAVVWLLVIVWSSVASQLVARHALDRHETPWRRE